MRQAYITEALVFAAQQGKISGRDRGRVMEYLRLNGWKLDPQVGMRNDLWLEVIRACPMLVDDAPAISTTATPAAARSTYNNPPEISFGFTKSPEK